jgi:hypothetical protein
MSALLFDSPVKDDERRKVAPYDTEPPPEDAVLVYEAIKSR